MQQRAGIDAPFSYAAASMNGLASAIAHDDGVDDDDDIDSPTSTIVPPSPAISRRASLVNSNSNSNSKDLTSEKPTVPATDTAAEEEDEEETEDDASSRPPSKLHPRVAVILGVDRKWYLPLVICRALSVVPALWWGLRCAFTFLAELLRIRPGMWREGWVAIIVGSATADWDVERRFRVTEVALAIMWVRITYLFVSLLN